MEFLSQYGSSSTESSQSSNLDDFLASQLKPRDTRTVHLVTKAEKSLREQMSKYFQPTTFECCTGAVALKITKSLANTFMLQ